MRSAADDLALALEMADVADDLTMAVFTGEALVFTDKVDGSPVTETDQAVEVQLRELVVTRRPGDGFLGEETGEHDGGGRRWIVDPIDGTASFVVGERGWGTQIALVIDDEIVVGVTSAPAIGRRWYGATGIGAFRRNRSDDPAPIGVSTSGSALRWTCHPPVDALTAEWRALVDGLAALGDQVRPSTHGALMVAEGEIDVCLQLEGYAWDHAAFAGVVTHAGGRFSYLDGSTRFGGGMRPALYSNGTAHDAVLDALGG